MINVGGDLMGQARRLMWGSSDGAGMGRSAETDMYQYNKKKTLRKDRGHSLTSRIYYTGTLQHSIGFRTSTSSNSVRDDRCT
jgi:hypothetical protein